MMEFDWQPFPQETLAAGMADVEKLQAVFCHAPDAPWTQALEAIGLVDVDMPLVRENANQAEFNMDALRHVLSGGAGMPPRGIFAHLTFFKAQWKIARFLETAHALPELVESIALGLCLQSLMLRLGGDEKMQAQRLAGINVPAHLKKTVSQIQAVQMRRTALSAAWNGLKRAAVETAAKQGLVLQKEVWQGLPVCLGQAQGKVALDGRGDGTILVFRYAHPETVEFFPRASAVVFATGGVMSHACTVAREMNIPCVTGLGEDFYNQIKEDKLVTLKIDGNTGSVFLVHL